eukprot:TRINITY_DN45884_c0_g1_i1.p1 TRINITY_DN45884_c0_g1~~TRINITY_DN45884_c0_g1_i1.p1  ORF type:complete len:882 (-),score=65.97 TRINITY_DN45884_c0_g1_i1:425-3070(-)
MMRCSRRSACMTLLCIVLIAIRGASADSFHGVGMRDSHLAEYKTACYGEVEAAEPTLEELRAMEFVNRSADIPLRCNSWGYCADPKIVRSYICSYRIDSNSFEKFRRQDRVSPMGWLGVHWGFLFESCREKSERCLDRHVHTYNATYIFIAAVLIQSFVALLVLLSRVFTVSRGAFFSLRTSCKDLAWGALEVWNDFPGLFEQLPANIRDLARQRAEEKRHFRFRALLALCGVMGPAMCLSSVLQWVIPELQNVDCTAGTHWTMTACQMDHLSFQREAAMTYLVALILGGLGLYSIVRRDFVTKRSITATAMALQVGMVVHLLEVQNYSYFEGWFMFNYVCLRGAIATFAGNSRLSVMLNVCEVVCELIKHSTEFEQYLAKYCRFAVSTTIGMLTFAAAFEYASVRETVLSVAAEHAVAEATRGRLVLDMLCDAVVNLKDLIIAESCPKLQALLLMAPSATGIANRAFLDCVVADDRARVRTRLDTSAEMKESVFVIQTRLQSAGLGSVNVQLCVCGFDDVHGKRCHMIGVREEDMQEQGRLDSLPSEMPPPLSIATPQVIGAASDRSIAARSIATTRTSAQSEGASSSVVAFDAVVESPEDEPENAASVWLDCSTPGKYTITRISKSMVYHLGPSLGISDFIELLADMDEQQKFVGWMDKILNSTHEVSQKRFRIRLRHWKTGLHARVEAKPISDMCNECVPKAIRLQLSRFIFKLKKKTKVTDDDQSLSMYAKKRSATPGALESLEMEEAALEAKERRHKKLYRTARYRVTPNLTRSLMALDLVRHWHVEGEAGACCDLHMRATCLVQASKLLFGIGCAHDQEIDGAWQCRGCCCLFRSCPTSCHICSGMGTPAEPEEYESRDEAEAQNDQAEAPLLQL